MPERIQLSRKKGFRLPENTVSVGRPSRWGNHFAILAIEGRFAITRFPEMHNLGFDQNDATYADTVEDARAEAVRRYRKWLESDFGDLRRRAASEELRGNNLACWCPLDQPCHADVLLELANKEDPADA